MIDYEYEDKSLANPRLLPTESLFNVRDLGGYPVTGGDEEPGDRSGDRAGTHRAGEGRQVKRGLLFRAGDLYNPSDGDRALLEKKGIRTIVDFRGKREVARAPDGELGTVKKTRVLSIEAGNMMDLAQMGKEVNAADLMEELYRILVDKARPQYREFFKILSQKESRSSHAGEAPQAVNAPLLFHCSAGKDRTGLAAALILSALGVEREIIYQDYLLSHTYLKEKYRIWLEQEPHLEPVMSIKRTYLEAAFARIEKDFGGMEQYLQTELGADRALLQELYTEAF
jgi:protein-tyrosine phosphatase